MSRRILTIRAKATLLAVAAVIFTASGFAVRNHFALAPMRTAAALAGLESSARLEASQIYAAFRDMESDARLLARLAADGLVLDTEHRPTALASMLNAAREARPVYLRVAAVGFGAAGYGAVQVTRHRPGGMPVPVDGPHDRLRADAELVSDGKAKALLLEASSRGMQMGQADGLVLRRVEPVRRGAEVIGALVMDIDYAAFLRQVPGQLGATRRLVIMNASRDHMVFEGTGPPVFVRHSPKTQGNGGPGAAEGVPGPAGPVAFAERTGFRVLIGSAPGSAPDAGLTHAGWPAHWAVVSEQNEVLFAEAAHAAGEDIASSAAMSVALVAFMGLMAFRLTQPLATLSAAIAARSELQDSVPRHIDAPGEVGQIARAFQALNADLVASTARIETIYRHAPVGIVSCDEDGTIVDMNPKAEAMFGFAEGSALGRPLDCLMPEQQRGLHAGRFADFEGQNPTMNGSRDITGLRQDGSQFPMSVALGSVRVGDRKTIIGILQDVAERRDAEKRLTAICAELEASKAELERSNRELDQFAYIASHDLKAPLRVIDNASRWLSEDLKDFLTDDTRESMALLTSRVHRMERLLDDLLAYSRVGRVKHAGVLVAGDDILQEVIALAFPPVGFRVEVDAGVAEVRLPRMPISSVLLNLISNAIKHHDRSGGMVRVSVEDRGDVYAFTVEDDGPGIAPEYQEKVFGMFQTLKPRDEVEGSGMGLAFVRKTIESVNGSLSLESQVGCGCVFRFTWPKQIIQAPEDAVA